MRYDSAFTAAMLALGLVLIAYAITSWKLNERTMKIAIGVPVAATTEWSGTN